MTTTPIVSGPAQVSLEAALERYLSLTPRSRAYFEGALESLAGGTTRTTVFFEPYPPVVVRGQGCWVEDLDGNRRLDFLNNYTSLILGHAHPAVVSAVTEQARQGTAFAAPTLNERRLAELIRGRVPSVERIRFTNSGTEATQFALRLARAFTRRDKVLMFEGGYHGTHDYAAAASSAGIPDAVRATVVSAPFNDLEATARAVRAAGSDLAAIIVEPILGAAGVLPARPEFLHGLRDLTRASGSLLIFDEVISLRVSPGGAQELYGVTPDLTTMGKIIGGGFPVAAFGGRAEVMALLDPRRADAAIPHGGTFNGNPVGTAAGIATLEALTPDVYARLNALGERLRARLRATFERLGVGVQVTGIGSLFNLHFTADEITDYRSSRAGANEHSRAAILALMNAGFFLAPRGMGCISTPMAETEVDSLVETVERILGAAVQPGAYAR
ncbi:MAG: aspartate aminotransferase family protein [Chloroflexota bacterium]|nr:aspartate aminotransferase family protein [Chloroflexota bacterium]